MKQGFSAEDHGWMARAIRVAEGGRYVSMPNPNVGCVLVQNGTLIGEGFSQEAGGPHAEVMALRSAQGRGVSTIGATAYVTLEPCSHHGRTPPCARALIEAGIGRVVAAMIDPNPLVQGNGVQLLGAAGIDVSTGLMEAQAREALAGFLSRVERGRPWLRLKMAASLDGKVAMASGESQWITGAEARADAQRLRARSSALITGSGTVLADDPMLTVRELDGRPWALARQPLRVVLDSRALMPPTARMLSAPGQTLVVTSEVPAQRLEGLAAAGAEVIVLPDGRGRVDLRPLLAELGRRGMNEVTVESGPRLNGAWLASGLVDEVVLYQAPVFLGNAAQGLAELSLQRLADKCEMRVLEVRRIGEDTRYVLRPQS